MKKHFTLEEKSKHEISFPLKTENPRKESLDFVKQFARVYSVEKVKKGSLVELILN